MHLVHGEETCKQVVVKITFKKDGKKQKYFDREVTTMKAVNHPSVVGYIDSLKDVQRCHLIIEYADGRNLGVIECDQTESFQHKTVISRKNSVHESKSTQKQMLKKIKGKSQNNLYEIKTSFTI